MAAANDSLLDNEVATTPSTTENNQGEYHVLGGESFQIDPLRNKPPPTLFLRAAVKSATLVVFSPLLLMGTTIFTTIMYIGPTWLQHRILSIMIPRIMKRQAENFQPERDTLLAGIHEGHCVLDVGCGGGAYLRHYTKASKIVALEPVQEMHKVIESVATQSQIDKEQLTILPCTIEEYAQLQQDELNPVKFDWIICGNVLCEVHDQRSTLESIQLLCKSGGHVYFSEHEGAPSGTWSRRMENWINPWWMTISGGCNCNRDTLQTIRSVLNPTDWELAVWKYPHMTVFLGPSFLALARKK